MTVEPAQYQVYTPVIGWSGNVGHVHFENGKAIVPNAAMELHHMVTNGYVVTDEDGVYIKDPLARLRELAAGPINTAASATPVRIVADETLRKDVDGDGVEEDLPRKSASVADWRAFAVEHGMAQADADAMTRDALVAHYYTPKEG